ncbi:MAG: hypothetical protein DRQ44_18615, partial [Gammaproteobacteria bacterium]
MSSQQHTAGDNKNDPAGNGGSVSDPWLQIAIDAHTQSTDYFEANIRKDVERNLSHFQSRHQPGSKYYSQGYKYRNKGFRPKTRVMVRKNEAAAAKALFSTNDAINVSAERANDEASQVSAEINQELLQYRLTNTIPWFKIAVGGYQDSLVAGVTISYQHWNYKEVEIKDPVFDENGSSILDEYGQDAYNIRKEVVKDTSAIDLRPLENILFSIAADWTDPIGTSPFLIDQIAMTVDDVKAMSKQTVKSSIRWIEVSEAQLHLAVNDDYNSVRIQREAKREDSKDERYITRGFDTVWVHRNIIKKDGRDWVFYTLGTILRLSEPVPLEEEYPHLSFGERPYVMGTANIETHKNYPESPTGMIAGMQQEANSINNQRRDNVELSMNRRYFVKKDAVYDKKALSRSVPGGITEMDDPEKDVKVEAPPDVTRSSYEEQDRVNADIDELSGTFSSSSMKSNRKPGETLGELELLNEDADDVAEYQLRIYVETWAEPVLKQLIKLEQYYETDEAILSLMGEKVNMWQRYNVSQITDAFIKGAMNCTVNVGFGATNPTQRVRKLAMGLDTVFTFAPEMQQRVDKEEIAKEVFGALGYKNTERFFPAPDPEAEKPGPPPTEPMTDMDQAKIQLDREIHQDKMKDMQMERQFKIQEAQITRETQMMKLSADNNISLESIRAQMQKTAT